MHQIDFDKFREYCDRRLKLLRFIENYLESKEGPTVPKVIKNFTKKCELRIAGNGMDELCIEEDNISHFLLRLGFSRTNKL